MRPSHLPRDSLDVRSSPVRVVPPPTAIQVSDLGGYPERLDLRIVPSLHPEKAQELGVEVSRLAKGVKVLE